MPADRDRDSSNESAPTVAASAPGTLVGRPGEPNPALATPPTASPPASRPLSGARSLPSSAGEAMRAATIERFGRVSADRFELLDELARGGLGRVFRARDPRTNRVVALKEVLVNQPEIVARFAREAMVTANLQHPSIVPVYEVGRWDNGDPYYAMKLVNGRTLDELIRETTTTAARVALLPHVIAVADALAYAHSESVIHRDLKPANVLVGAFGETVVIDWGLAKNLATGEELDALPYSPTIPPNAGETIAGSVLGTPAYMPPEQANGDALDEHADVYAIGAILYHVLTGTRPYAQCVTLEELMTRVRREPPRAMAEVAPDLPRELIAITETAMARVPKDRYATAEGLAQDLRRYQAGKLVAAHHYTSWQLVRRWVSQHRALVVVIAAAAVGLLAIGSASIWRIAAERDVANEQRANAQEQRTEALAATALAEKRFADSLEDLARHAMIAAQPDRALTLLGGEVASRSVFTPAFDILASQARAAYGDLVALAPPMLSGYSEAQLSATGQRVYLIAAHSEARAWDFSQQRVAWEAHGIATWQLSPDDHWLVGAAADGGVFVRTADSGEIVASWPKRSDDPATRPSAFRWAADSLHFAAIAPSGRVVLGARDGKALADVAPDPGAAAGRDSLAYSPDGRILATADANRTVVLRDATTGATLAQLVDGAPPSILSALEWLDNDRLVTGDDQGVARIWRVATHTVERRVPHGYPIFGFVVGDGWVATLGGADTLFVWDPATGALGAKLPGHQLGCDYGATDGTHLITADDAGDVFVWDPRTGERLRRLPPEGASIAVQTRGDRTVVYTTGRLRVFRFATDTILRHVTGHTARVRDLAFAADGTLWSASNDGTARGVDLATGVVRVLGQASWTEPTIADGGPLQPPSPHGLRSLTLTPDGTRVVTAVEDGTIAVWDAATGAPRATWTGHTGRARRVVFTHDGHTAYSVGDTTLRAWDVATGRELGHVDLGAKAWDVALVDGEHTVATQTESDVVALWKASTLGAIVALPDNQLRSLVTVDDHVLFASHTQLFRLGADGEPDRHGTEASTRAADTSARWIAVANQTEEMALFDAATFALIRAWQTPDNEQAVRFRPDGAIIATLSGRRAQLWDPATGNLVAETPELPARLFTLAWSTDGRRLAIAGGSGTIWVWDLPRVEPPALAAFAKCVSPWKLDDAALVQADYDPATCTGVLAGR